MKSRHHAAASSARPPKAIERQADASGFELWARCVIAAGAHLPAIEARVILAIGLHDWAGWGDGCTASVPTLAAETGFSERTVQRALKGLVGRELVNRKARRKGIESDSIRINRTAVVQLLGGDRLSPVGDDVQSPEGRQPRHEGVTPATLTGDRIAGESLTVKAIQESPTERPYQEPAEEDHEVTEFAPRKAVVLRTTWLTSYADLWRANFSAEMPFGVAAKNLKPLHDRHGEPAVFKALGNYLAAHQGERASFLSLPKFASTFGQWLNPAPARLSQHERNLAVINRVLGDPSDG